MKLHHFTIFDRVGNPTLPEWVDRLMGGYFWDTTPHCSGHQDIEDL